jgi:ribosomal protein S21
MINAEVKINNKVDGKIALDRALRVLKLKLVKEGTMDVVRSKRQHETPKQKRERKRKQNVMRSKILGEKRVDYRNKNL